MGLRKPDAEAFHHVLSRHGAEPSRTLFIDDSIQHVVGARAAGLQAEHLDLAHDNVIKLVHRWALME
jgi:putative hydrolase of the HAD superfamily